MADIYNYSIPSQKRVEDLPFELKFNFKPYIDYIRAFIAQGRYQPSQVYLNTLEKIEKERILTSPFSDQAVIAENIEDIKLLMSPVFPDMLTHNEIKAIIIPFSNYLFNPSERLKGIFDSAGDADNVVFEVEDNTDPYINTGILILNWLYKANIDFGGLYYFVVKEKETGIEKHYRSLINADFTTLKRKPGTPELTPSDIEELKENINNKELWMEKLPPGSYEFEGISIVTMLDVSRERYESHLKNLLLKSDVLDNPEQNEQLKNLFRTYFKISDLEIGLVAYDNAADRTKPMGFGLWQSILLSDDKEACSIQQLGEDIVHQLKVKKNELIVNVNEMIDENCEASRKLILNKVGSYAIYPLSHDGELIALIEMSSAEKHQFDLFTSKKFENIKDLFTSAIKRYLDEYDVKLEAIIKEKCTAIHPTVEWKFKQEAELFYRNKLTGQHEEIKDLEFHNVHPLYGQTDIKDSSLKRNAAIKNDLMDQLRSLKKIFVNAFESSGLPYYGQLLFKIETIMNELGLGLGVGDEVSILDFIKKEVEPNLEHVESMDASNKTIIKKYFNSFKGDSNTVNKRREEYEKSVANITKTITEMMAKRQDRAQKMFPHYYEKYKTDGVEHNIYIGESLVKGQKYFPLYLKNLRLWQLMSMIEIENKLYEEKESLKVKLEVCSLILVHSNPITIRFRMDEKKFDVEGAYNIRYEIIKKRIDKSLIQKTKERLTQPGKVAIVFAHSNEEREYKTYLKYLESIGYIKQGIEVLDLAPVQGINGLRALRVSINYRNDMDLESSMRMLEATMN
jgi:hypothetical protein